MDVRLRVWLLLLASAAVSAFAYAGVTPVFDAADWRRVALFPVLGSAGFSLVFLVPRFKGRRASVLGIWLPAVLLRVLLLPVAPSDDMNRYLWEGHLVQAGVSPYAQTADSPELEDFRDAYWSAMNHRDKRTAYPPLAELIFAGASRIDYRPWSMKALVVLADLLVLGAVLSLLRRRGLSQAYAGFYAFNPVVLIAFSGEGHFDAFMLAALVWALWADEVGRPRLALVLASMATGIKWVTVGVLPFFARKGLVSGALISLGVLLVPALCFWDSLPSLFAGLFEFGGLRSFNGPVYACLLHGLDLPRNVCSGLVSAGLAAVILWCWRRRESVPLDSHIRWILGSLIVLSPTVHFWYLTWVLPFVCLRPSLPWLTFSFTGGAYFFVWMNPQWGLSMWQQCFFWAPFFAAVLYELWSTRGRVVMPTVREAGLSESVAVVIPTYNVAEQLPDALESLHGQETRAAEIIVVDAGSSDGTVAVARGAELPIRVLDVGLGRGEQIAAGIEAATADWVVVLHADAELRPDAIGNLLWAVRADRTVMGGALGQRFEERHSELVPIELLNDLRVLFTRTAFGDQVQFFHRESALRYALMPKQPLMEDVESSWRVREQGGFLYLNQACRVCHRKWNRTAWFVRFRLVMGLVGRYRFARLRSRCEADRLSRELYGEYYPIRK